MEQIDGYDHWAGRHAGAAAVRNVLEYYEWRPPAGESFSANVGETTVFALGSGLASVVYDRPEGPGLNFLGRSLRLEPAVFEALGVPHRLSEDEDFDAAWADVVATVESDDPVLVFLDPGDLDHVDRLAEGFPHVSVVVGHRDDEVLLADPDARRPQRLDREALREAWRVEGPFGGRNRYLVVDSRHIEADRETAATRALGETTGYMLDAPETDERVRGSTGRNGVEAIRAFADEVARWPDLDAAPEVAAYRSISGRGRMAACRRLYAKGLEDVAPAAGLGENLAGRMHDVADEWVAVADRFAAAHEADAGDRERHLETAASELGDIADREQAFFEDVRESL